MIERRIMKQIISELEDKDIIIYPIDFFLDDNKVPYFTYTFSKSEFDTKVQMYNKGLIYTDTYDEISPIDYHDSYDIPIIVEYFCERVIRTYNIKYFNAYYPDENIF